MKTKMMIVQDFIKSCFYTATNSGKHLNGVITNLHECISMIYNDSDSNEFEHVKTELKKFCDIIYADDFNFEYIIANSNLKQYLIEEFKNTSKILQQQFCDTEYIMNFLKSANIDDYIEQSLHSNYRIYNVCDVEIYVKLKNV